MKLVFINKAGMLHNGKYIYEFQFSSKVDEAYTLGINDYDWDQNPANGRPKPIKELKSTFYVTTEHDFHLVKDSYTFSMEDAKEGIVALAFSYSKIFGSKLKLFYGQDFEKVKEVLFEKSIKIKEENIFA